MEPTIIFEDDDVLVIEKPSGVTVNRAETTKGEETGQDGVEDYLKVPRVPQVPRVPRVLPAGRQGEEARGTRGTLDTRDTFHQRSGIVHRLDKETSGLLLVAKMPEAFENLQRQFKARTVKKKYTALVHGNVVPQEGEINVPVARLPWNRMRFGVLAGGREAVTKYKVTSYYASSEAKTSREVNVEISSRQARTIRVRDCSLLELYPQTGRTHQIRVHLKYMGYPIVSDPLYAGRKQAREDRKWCPRLFLHAGSITLQHPKTGDMMTFEAELPEDLQSVVERLR